MTGDARDIFDPAAFDRQMGGDAGLRAEIVQMFLEDCPQRVGEIRAAITAADARALTASAHALKGSAAYMSAAAVRDRAADLERLGRDGALAGASPALDQLESAVAALLPELHKLG